MNSIKSKGIRATVWSAVAFSIILINFIMYKCFIFDFLLVSFMRFHSIIQTPICAVIYIILSSILGMFILFKIFNKIIYRKFLIIFYTLYGLIMFYFAFLKSSHIRGIELNPLKFLMYFRDQSFETFMNLFMFIPAGLLIGLIQKESKRAIPLLISIIFI